MRRLARSSALILFAAMFLVDATPAVAQVFVYPRRPGRTNARYDDFDWRHLDLFTGPGARIETTDPGPRGGAEPKALARDASPSPEMTPRFPSIHPAGTPAVSSDASGGGAEQTAESDGSAGWIEKAGGMRLYYYRSERNVARSALPILRESYRELTSEFEFGPPKTFPFVLYNSYQEFLQTNLFPIQEGVLGVTSPRSLKMTVPYFGDRRRFRRITEHELVHQFTIQKVRSVGRKKETFRDPVDQIPLWFIEGLAEYYSQDGLDPETEMLVRDLVVHPAPERGYTMRDFFSQGPRSYLWIYKVGQARVAFLEEVFGEGTLQKILEQTYRLGQGRWKQNRLSGFEALVSRVVDTEPSVIDAKFEEWIKKRAYANYVEASQHSGDFPRVETRNRFVRALETSRQGHLLAYKTVDRQTGQHRLFVVDERDVKSETRVVTDGRPGYESLHPLDEANFDVGSNAAVFAARSRGRDVIYWHELDRQVEYVSKKSEETSKKKGEKRRSKGGGGGNGAQADEGSERTVESVEIHKRRRRAFHIAEKGIRATDALTLSPDGDSLAFLGLDSAGQRDVYLLHPRGDGYNIEQVTDNRFSERGLAWGPEGLVYTSDKTGHGHYNLFEVDPEPGAQPERLTSEPRDHMDPAVRPNGDVVFVAFDDARANLHTIGPNGEAVRRTDVSTGLFNPSSAPGGDLWALYHHSGQRVPVRIGANRLGEHERRRPAPDLSVPELEKGSLSASSAYKPLALRNWQFDNGMGILGVTGSGIYGQLYASASDRLRNHRLMLDLVAFGELRRTDGSLTYINQSNRIIWGLSLFQDFKFRVDETFDSVDRFISADRFYGARGILRYPFSQYTYLQMALAAGGVSYFLPGDSKRLLNERDTVNESQTDTYLSDDWHRRNSSPRAQGEAQLSFGFDNIHYQRQTGPLAGTSFLASVTGDYQPGYDVLFANARIDGETYLPVYKRLNLFFRLGSGAAFGDRFARQFFLSSFYTLRGVPFGDPEFLLGRNFAYSTLEFQFPLNFIVRVPFVDIEGIVGADFGGVGNSVTSAWQHRVFDAVAGFNFGFGPIVLRVHFAKPFDIGGAETPNDGEMVPNISVGWRYL